MRSSARLLLLALGLVTALIAGCSSAEPDVRHSGARVDAAEARTLGALLHRNFQRGGAAFVVTVPYGAQAVLTLTGEVDFRTSAGRAQAVTTYNNGHADDTRTLFFTRDTLWCGDVPGLTTALVKAGKPKATYLSRPLTLSSGAGKPADLLDVVVQILLDLSSPSTDDSRFFLGRGYTWQGQRSIDSRLATLFSAPAGRTVAVDAADDQLVQYVTRLPLEGSGSLEVTVTLSDHGPRTIEVPTDGESVAAADQPRIAAAFGI
jgi:hypothetical protein